jgi:hypothetical protein
MTVQDHQSVSDDVRQLLTRTYDEKLLRGGTVDATRFARDAFKKATDLLEERSHWQQLASYRLAHLLLRRDGSLEEIDKLLTIAEGADFLEPLRSFCHLVVLDRIRDGLRATDERDAVTARLEKVFAIATGKLQTFRTSDTADAAYKAQDSAFNTLELLSYALGLPYGRLEGISRETDFSPYRDRRSASHAWQVLSRDFKSVWMTEDFARREFATRVAIGPCITVEITPDDAKWALQPREKSEWKTISLRHARLIAALLSNPAMSLMDLRKEVADDREPTDRFKKAKQRTKDEIQELVGKQLTVFKERSASKMFDLTDEIRFLVLRNH